MTNIYRSILLLAVLFSSTECIFAQVLKNDSDNNVNRQKEFIAFNADYLKQKEALYHRLGQIYVQLYQKESSGQHVECAHELFSEIAWLFTATADLKTINAEVQELEDLLKAPAPQKKIPSNGQNPDCSKSWFFKVIAHYDALKKKSDYAFLLDTINSPEKLTAYFRSVAISDIPRTGIDNGRELNESLSNLMRLILRNQPEGYRWHPQLKETMMKLILNDLRNPVTGYWGERYVRNGKVEFVDDISITFHLVSYLDGKVPDMDKVLKTTLAIKNYECTSGWLYKGNYWNHISMDVVTLFKYCWPYATKEQKKDIDSEMEKMLHWCITQSLQPDGSFKPIEADASIEEATSFGEEFLNEAGFFDPAKRFWTNRTFPEAEGIRQNIISFIRKHISSGATGGEYYRSALKDLEGKSN